MGRALRTPHKALQSYTTADALFLLRCDEAGGAVDLTDALGIRTMTQTASPGAALSVFRENGQPAGRGARTFNGTTQYAGRTHDADQAIFAAATWGWMGWFTPTVVNVNQTILEFGEFGGGDVNGPLMRARIINGGSLRIDWLDSTGAARNNNTAAFLIAAGVPVHLGMAVRPSRTVHSAQDILFYVNGECVQIITGRPLPASGTAARWIVGASRAGGTAINTPGEFYGGSIDDLIFVQWTPEPEWFREAYANGTSEFYERENMQVSDGFLQGNTPGQGFGALQEVYTRVLVEVNRDVFNSQYVNGTDLDLTNVLGLGYDLVRSAEWKDHVDDTGPSATVSLVPRWMLFNLSPAVALSAIYGVFANRVRVKIEQAFVPVGTGRLGAAPYFRLMFDGMAMSPEIANGDEKLTIISSPLAQAWVEPNTLPTADEQATGDRTYGAAPAGGRAIELCAQDIIDDHDPSKFTIVKATGAEGVPNGIAPATGVAPQPIQIRLFGTGDEHGKGRPHAIANGDSILISGTTNYNGIKTAAVATTSTVVQCSETSSAAAEQTGTVKMLPIHSYRGLYPTVWCPTSPGFNMFTISEPSSKSVLQAVQGWFDEIGWAFRRRYDDTRKQFRMKAYDPRAVGSSLFLSSDLIYPPDSFALRHEFQRTAGVVEFASAAVVDNKGERVRQIVGYGELARNGDRYYFRVVNDNKSLITDSTAAQKELDGLKTDLGVAPAQAADMIVDTVPDPRVDLGDNFDVFSENGETPLQLPSVFDGETICAVGGYTHHAERGRVRTKLAFVRVGNGSVPAGRRAQHHATRLPSVGRQKGLSLRSGVVPAAPTITNLAAINAIRFAMITWTFPFLDLNRGFDIMEVHWSTTTGFPPSSSTLKGIVRGTMMLTSGFTAGVVYFVKVIATDNLGNRTAASAQSNFTS